MATLDNGFFVWQHLLATQFLLIEAFDFAIPLFLNNLNHIALVLWFEKGKVNFNRAFFDLDLLFGGRLGGKLGKVVEPLLIVAEHRGWYSLVAAVCVQHSRFRLSTISRGL